MLLHIYAAVLYARHTPSLPSHLLPKPSPSITIPPLPSRTPQEPLAPQPALPPSLPACTPPPITPPTTNPSPHTSHPHSTHHHPPSDLPYPPIRSIYITAPNPFAELDKFVISSTKLYGLDLYRFGGGMKAALEDWLGCGGGRAVKSVLVGTRLGDPNDGQFISIHPTHCVARVIDSMRSSRRYNSTHRPFLAPVHPHTPYSSLDILGCMAISPGTSGAVLCTV